MKLNDKKNYQILSFSLNIDQKQQIQLMISSKNSIMSRKKKFVKEKTTKFDHIFDTRNFILCIVYDEVIDEKLFENLNSKFVILQTKEICQFFLFLKIVNSSTNARNEIININENKNNVSNAQTLITRAKIRFLFSLKSVFSMTRQKILKKRSKNKSFENKKFVRKFKSMVSFRNQKSWNSF